MRRHNRMPSVDLSLISGIRRSIKEVVMPASPRQVSPETVSAIQSGLRVIVLGTERYRRLLAEQLGVSVTEIVVLGHLFNYGPMTPREIADWLGFSTGATTGVLDRAERAGLLTRRANPADRRSVVITLSANGKRALTWMYKRTNDYLSEALEGYSEDELDRLATVMRLVGESLQVATPELPTHRQLRAEPVD
jgi:DNA-binding MarR family transcriptional regulator